MALIGESMPTIPMSVDPSLPAELLGGLLKGPADSFLTEL